MNLQDMTDNGVPYSAACFGTSDQPKVRPQSCCPKWNKKLDARDPGSFRVESGRWRARIWSKYQWFITWTPYAPSPNFLPMLCTGTLAMHCTRRCAKSKLCQRWLLSWSGLLCVVKVDRIEPSMSRHEAKQMLVVAHKGIAKGAYQ